MMTLAFLAAGFCALATLVHLLTTLLAVWRCRVPRRSLPAPADAPPISLVRPVCGIETFSEATLRSSFRLDYPRYELIFCVARGSDPVIPLVRRLIAEHPGVPAKLLIGEDRISANPKLNNMVKGWHGAAHDHIVFADSNVLMPVDYLQRMLRAWTHRAGMVCAPPAGTHPDGFWAQVECAFLNTYQARFQYAADSLGIGFAQGKNLLYRRDILERGGGIAALATELAEDAASTKVVRAQGLTVRLAGPLLAAARLAPGGRSLEPAGALGAAAPGDLRAAFRRRGTVRLAAAAAGRFVRNQRARTRSLGTARSRHSGAASVRRRLPRAVARCGGVAGPRGWLASGLAIPRRLAAARRDAAAHLARGLARR